MADTISAFGYTVPLVVVLAVIALVIGLGLVILFWLTVVWSIYRSVGTTRRQEVRDELQDQLLERVFEPETDWSPWVEDMSRTEREVVEELLDEYLRELDGQHVKTLQRLGDELGLPSRAQQRLNGRGTYRRLYALTWLALLDRPEKLRETDFTPRTPRERASVARLRYECDDLPDTMEGLKLLLDGATSQFSVFGQDTLYRIAIEEPSALFTVAADNYQSWSDALLVQVLVVCQHLGETVTTEDLDWLTSTLEHENDVVREAAAIALGTVGWRSDIRDDPRLDTVLEDSSPRVRGAFFRMLADWGDEQALDRLTTALQTEVDARARLAGTNALARQRDTLPDTDSEDLATCWAWSHEQVRYDRVARRQVVSN